MATFRVEKSRDYTVMSNHHLRDASLSLKAKGLLSQMLSLPEGWDYTLSGLAEINREGVDAIRSAVNELEEAGYVVRRQTVDENGKFSGNEYIIHEQPVCDAPLLDFPTTENPTQLNKDILSKDIKRKKKKEKEKSEKSADAELSLDEVKPLLVENLRRMGEAGAWSAATLNQLYTSLVEFYSPRPIKGNKSPPMKSMRGINGLCNKLMRDSGGDPAVILDALDDAITAGWTTAHPKPRTGFASAAPSAVPKPDQLEGKRWL